MTYIARLNGEVVARGPDFLIVEVAGVGYRALVPTGTAAASSVGSRITLHTHLQFREDGASLFGFADPEELTIFEQLITVSGVGPRSALALLSVVPVGDLQIAIAGGAADVLRRVPGIGAKTAGRIILELQSKIEIGAPNGAAAATAPSDVVAALRSLGYSQQEVLAGLAATPDAEGVDTEDRLRAILRYFARQSG